MPDPSRLDAGITEIADAFDRWLADSLASPDQYGEPDGSDGDYGERCATHLAQLIEQARADQLAGS